MFKSKEIRWFTETPDPHILDWFRETGRSFENTQSRDDFYLPLRKNDISVKLREGNIEAKHRIGEASRLRLTAQVEGIMENWVKWSFKVDEADRLSNDIIQSGKYDWIKTTKKRMGVKVTHGKPKRNEILDISGFIESGCQIEYTEIQIFGKRYYTFGLEWFGENHIELDQGFLNELLGESKLNLAQSRGYCQFILDLQSS